MRIGWLAPLLLIGCGPSGDGASNQEAAVPAPVAPDAMLPAAAPEAPAAATSAFTSLDTNRCRLVAKNIEEGGYSRHDCPGHAGYRLELIESDLRQNLAILRPDGSKDELRLSSEVGGGGFSEIGKTVEWRGRDPAKPRTLTLRFILNEDPDPKVPPRSYLVVVRLASPACPIAVVSPGAAQSDEARRIADAPVLAKCRRS